MKEKNVKLWSKNFIIIIIVNFLVFLNHLMILSTFPFFISYLGYSDSISGLCVTLFCVVSVICRPFVGWMLDNGKRKLILLIGIIGMALMPMGYLLVYTALSSIALADILRMNHGNAHAFSNPSTSTIASEIIPKERFSEGMGMFGMATALATACAPAIGEKLMNKSFTTLFTTSTGCMVLCLFLYAFLSLPKLNIARKPFNIKLLIDYDALPASCVVLIFENYTLKFAVQSDKITISGGAYFTVMSIALLLTRVFIGKQADKKGESIFVYICNIFMFAALLLLAFIPNNITFIISSVLSGFAFGGIEPSLQAMAVNIAPPERRGAANSTFLCAYDIGIGIGGGIAGVLIDCVGYNHMFAIISVANVISIIIYAAWGSRHPSSMTYRIKNGLN